jgi:serine/threonine protein kinase
VRSNCPKYVKENVLVDDRGITKVIDFGLSRLMENTTLWETSTKGGAPGTVRYQAPELMIGNQTAVTMEGDIYAFGITCWVSVFGSRQRRDILTNFLV